MGDISVLSVRFIMPLNVLHLQHQQPLGHGVDHPLERPYGPHGHSRSVSQVLGDMQQTREKYHLEWEGWEE